MKMKEYYLDLKLSQKVYNNNKDLLEIGKCYNNVFNIITCREIVNKDIKIAYGFIYRKSINIFSRHCFILLEDKTVIDPTTLFWKAENVADTIIYYPFKAYTFHEYLLVLSKKANRTDLYNELLKEEVQAHNNLTELGFTRNPMEIGEFLQRVYKENLWEGIEEYNKNNKVTIKK